MLSLIAAALMFQGGPSATVTLRVEVPPICQVQNRELLCNSSYPYIVYVRRNGVLHEIERGSGPVRKQISYRLATGESFVVVMQ